MFKKSLKYLIIVVVNALVLTILLVLWTDRFELIFHKYIRALEFSKIIGISFLGLIILRIVVSCYRTYKLTSVRKRIIVSSLLMIGISSFLYFNYMKKIYEHSIRDSAVRISTVEKIKVKNSYPYGSSGLNLTIDEYTEIINSNWFPPVSKEASNISYRYYYDDFLPDYSLNLTYDIPKNITIDTFNITEGQFIKSQSFQIIGTIKKVQYEEIQL